MKVITKSPIFYRDASEALRRYPHRTVMFIKDNNEREFSFWVKVESGPNLEVENVSFYNNYVPSRYNWTPVQLTIKDVISHSITDPEPYQFLRDWMMSDNKYDVTLDRLDPTGVTIQKWLLHGSFIQEMRQEIVFDRTVDDITIRLNYDYALLT